MFPYMAEWLPREEGEQLLMEFMEGDATAWT